MRSGAGCLSAGISALAPSHPEHLCPPTASFKRPVVILGPIADIAVQKLSRELPELFEIARKCLHTEEEIISSGQTVGEFFTFVAL